MSRGITVTSRGSKLVATFPYDPSLITTIKSMAGRWDPDGTTCGIPKAWWWDYTIDIAQALKAIGATLDPAATELVERFSKPADRSVDEITPVSVPENFVWLASTPGYDHQKMGSAWRRGHGKDGQKHRSCAFEMGLGTGKTLLTVEEVLKLKSVQPDAQVLVICPNTTRKSVWLLQVAQHSGGVIKDGEIVSAGSLDAVVLDGPMDKRRKRLLTERHDIWIHNNESLSDMGIALANHKFTMIVIDEHAKFRNHLAAKSKCLLGQGKFKGHALTSPYNIALSGHPWIKRATDLYTTYKWLGAPTGNIAQFRTQHCIMGGYMGNEELGIKPNSGLHAMLDQFRFVVPKGTVLNLPRAFHTHMLKFDKKQQDIYDRVQRDLVVLFEDEEHPIFNHLTMLLRLAQVTAGLEAISTEEFTWYEDNVKAKFLFEELLPDLLEEQDKVIIWANYRAEIDNLTRMANERGIKAVKFYGKESGYTDKDREDAEKAFKYGDAKLFIANTQAAGLGLNLPMARTMVYYTRTYNTEAWVQSLERNARMDTKLEEGQDLNVIVLEVENTIDQHITSVLTSDVENSAKFTSADPLAILGRKPKASV